jgi:hypothetical protein
LSGYLIEVLVFVDLELGAGWLLWLEVSQGC